MGLVLLVGCSATPLPQSDFEPTKRPVAGTTVDIAAKAPASTTASASAPSLKVRSFEVKSRFGDPDDASRVSLFAVDNAVVAFRGETGTPGLKVGALNAAGTIAYNDKLRILPIDSEDLHVKIARGRYPDALEVVNVELGGPLPLWNHQLFANGAWKVVGTHGTSSFAGMVKRDASEALLMPHYMAAASGLAPTWWTLKGSAMPLTFASATCSHGPTTFETNLTHEAVASGPTGTVVAYGKQCGEKPAVEVWTSNSTASTFMLLPESSGMGAKPMVHVAGPKAIWIIADGLWHYDGKWKVIAPPKDRTHVTFGYAGPDGSLWFGFDYSSLYQRIDKAWRAVTMPEGLVPESMVITKMGGAWIVGMQKELAYSPKL